MTNVAETKTEYAPGTEPVQEYVEPEPGEVNPNTGIHYHDVGQAKKDEALFALASGDMGAARRALFGDTDEGIHGRLPEEPANPVPDPKALEKLAKGQREVREKQAELEQQVAGLADKLGGSTAVKGDQGPATAAAQAGEKS